MCPTDPQKDPRSRKGNERFSETASKMEFLGSIGARDGSSELTPCASRLTIEGLRYALCALRYAPCEKLVTMPAIVSREDLKIAQRDFRSMFIIVSPYDLRFTPYGLRYALLHARFCTPNASRLAPDGI